MPTLNIPARDAFVALLLTSNALLCWHVQQQYKERTHRVGAKVIG